MNHRGSLALDLRQRFVDGLRRHGDRHLLDLSPSDLALVAAEAIGAASAGLTLVQPLVRLPIGASDQRAEAAEQVQASVGTGPSVEAVATGAPTAADEAELRARWPVYQRFLQTRAGFRATASFPLRQLGGKVFGALDLFSETPRWRPAVELVDLQRDVADLVGMMLVGSILGRAAHPAWPGDDRARNRQQVWVSIGMVREATGVTDADAISMLRAYAFSHDQLLDEVAAEMLTGRLLPEAVAGER